MRERFNYYENSEMRHDRYRQSRTSWTKNNKKFQVSCDFFQLLKSKNFIKMKIPKRNEQENNIIIKPFLSSKIEFHFSRNGMNIYFQFIGNLDFGHKQNKTKTFSAKILHFGLILYSRTKTYDKVIYAYITYQWTAKVGQVGQESHENMK